MNRQPRSEHTPAKNRRLARTAYTGSGQAILITIRADHGEPFQENTSLCGVVIALLGEMRRQHDSWVGAYCLMPDHLHFLCGGNTEDAEPLTFVEQFKGRSTNMSWQHGWSGRLWQKRFHDHLIRSARDISDMEAYVLANPQRAGPVEEAEDWEWAGVLDPQR